MIRQIREKSPMVHCITNYVTAGWVADTILALDASPVMADEIKDVEEIVSLSQALVLNIGTLNDRKLESMIKAGKMANQMKIPVVLDPVGVGASDYRLKAVLDLLEKISFTVVKGNESEIDALIKKQVSPSARGVDTSIDSHDSQEKMERWVCDMEQMSHEYLSVVVSTGKTDTIVYKGEKAVVHNGCEWMKRITGTGCMLDGILGVCCAVYPDQFFHGSVCGVSLMGLSGELAFNRIKKEKKGTGSFRMYLMDELSQMTDKIWKEGKYVEIL